jgi:hypothetical protein
MAVSFYVLLQFVTHIAYFEAGDLNSCAGCHRSWRSCGVQSHAPRQGTLLPSSLHGQHDQHGECQNLRHFNQLYHGIHSFIHSVVCLTTLPLPLPKWVFYRVRSSASSFNFQYPLFSLRSYSSCLCLFPYGITALILFCHILRLNQWHTEGIVLELHFCDVSQSVDFSLKGL